MLIFGSTALKHWFQDLNREPKDLDYISKDGKNSKEVEYHWAPSFQYIVDNNKDSVYVDPNYLYTIKVSHAAWDIRWEKTIRDIKFMKDKGCVLDIPLYEILLKDWNVIHSEKRIRLKGTPEEFFNKNIARKVPHEQLHDIVKFYDKPLHESIRPDKNDVACSKKLWDNLSQEDKLKCALEETYVFAIERYSEYPPNIALSKALKHLITKSTKGYFNLFMIDNFFDLLYYDRDRYIGIFKKVKDVL